MRLAPTVSRLHLGAMLPLLLLLGACMDHNPLGTDPQPESARRSEVGAAAFNGRVRVGVVPSATSVSIGSEADYTIRDKETNAVLMTGTNGSATVTLASVVLTYHRLQVTCGSLSTVEARKAAAEAAGYDTYVEYYAAKDCYRLLLGKFRYPTAWSVRVAFRNKLISEGHAGTDSFWVLRTDPGVTVYRVTRGSTVVDALNPVVLTSSSGIVTINGRKYRDVAEARVNSQGTLAGINELPIDQYLYGVVPRELGPVLYPEVEAQKAQAVAARTFAISRIGHRSADGYDLLATVTDQVYGGYQDEHPVSSAAVDATSGVVATHGGRLIVTNYSSASGGHTANNEESFAGAPVAYLRGVIDAELGQAQERAPTLEAFKTFTNPLRLRANSSGAYEGNWARYHRWTFEWSMEEISEVISAYAGRPVGKVLAINALERGPSGRIIRIEYVTEVGSFTASRFGIRTSLRYKNASQTYSALPSTLFFVEPLHDARTGDLTGYRVYGGGFGHGVGLSQTGAVGMAQRGHTYEQILKHYYTGIDLTRWY